MSKKLTAEGAAFDIWIQLYYSLHLWNETINDAEMSLKESKKHRARTKHLLGKAEALCIKLTGRNPINTLNKKERY